MIFSVNKISIHRKKSENKTSIHRKNSTFPDKNHKHSTKYPTPSLPYMLQWSFSPEACSKSPDGAG